MEIEPSEVLVFSGGADSAVALYDMLFHGKNVSLLHVDFGKPASARELAAAKRFSIIHHLPLEVIDFQGATRLQTGYVPAAQIARDELDVVDPGPIHPSGFHVLLALASYFAQITGRNGITISIIREQITGRPTLPDALRAFERHIELLNDGRGKFEIATPLADLEKDAVISLGSSLGTPFQFTWSCLYGLVEHCGVCDQCKSRKAAFEKAKVEDPTTYLN
jgi:7-cyano-7-deazaguanine synthase